MKKMKEKISTDRCFRTTSFFYEGNYALHTMLQIHAVIQYTFIQSLNCLTLWLSIAYDSSIARAQHLLLSR